MRRRLFIFVLLFAAIGLAVAEAPIDPLTEAARDGKIAKMKSIIKSKKGKDDFVKGIYPATYGPLHAAAYSGQLEAVKLLVESGYDLNCGLSDPSSYPIALAMNAGRFEVVAYLLGKNPDLSGVKLRSLLAKPLDDPRKQILESLLAGGAPLSPGDFAACRVAADLEYLVSRGFSLTSADATGMTALHYAADSMNMEAVNFLLDHQVDVNAADNGGYTPLFYALMSIGADVRFGGIIGEETFGGKTIYAIKRTSEEPYYGDMTSIVQRQVALVDLLIAKGADLNAQTKDGNTVLHMLACTNKLTTIQYLINAGAKKDLANLKGETPYDFAVINSVYLRNAEIVSLLSLK